jgi:ABC-type Fe3+ transport system permease subunit
LNGAPSGWNWGAFLLGWLWALGHRLWIPAVLGFIPILNILMMPVFGLKGNAWAWERGTWSSATEFRRSQHLWAQIGAALWGASAVAVLVVLVT